MARKADVRIHMSLKVMRFGRRTKDGDSDIAKPGQNLVFDKSMKARPHMAIHARHVFM